ncbi:MAG: hypothetical protein LQ340_000138 [Diploschistes diacapsis]|nr:MAG: hypothetical protein LQ340_000138 [Diploschistes diacapsis]
MFERTSIDPQQAQGYPFFVSIELGTGAAVLRRFLDQGTIARSGIDMLFLNHDEARYKADFRLAWRELRLLRKGYVVVDNVVQPEALGYQAVRREIGLESYEVKRLIVPGDREVSFFRMAEEESATDPRKLMKLNCNPRKIMKITKVNG